MPLPVVVEDQESLPEGLAEYYEEAEDGRFVLSVDGVDNHPEVHGLKTAYQKEKEKRQQLAKQRDELKGKADLIPEDMDADQVQQAIEAARSGKTGEVDTEKLKQQIERRYQGQLEERDQKLQVKDQQVRSLVVDQGLTAALAKNNVTNPAYQRAAKKLLADQIKVEEDYDGNVQAVAETDKGELPLEQFVQKWVSSDEGQAFVAGNQGSGARGAQGGGQQGRKTMSRGQFEELGPAEKAEFVRNGGQVTD